MDNKSINSSFNVRKYTKKGLFRVCRLKSVYFLFQLASVEREKQRWEKEKSQLKASIEENKERMLKLESYWIEAQTLCHTVNEHLKEAQAQYQTLEKKYNKAKKLIKDFQQKWVNSLSYLYPGRKDDFMVIYFLSPHS